MRARERVVRDSCTVVKIGTSRRKTNENVSVKCRVQEFRQYQPKEGECRVRRNKKCVKKKKNF